MLSHKFKCIFIHIPKTAGQSIEHIFLNLSGLDWDSRSVLLMKPNKNPLRGPPRLAHLKAAEYVSCKYISEVLFKEYFKFSFVRNPWDRIVSSYKYREFDKKTDFKTFIYSYTSKSSWTSLNRHLLPQYHYLYDDEGKSLVDFIGRFEQLQEGFDEICRRLDIPKQILPHVNSTTGKQKSAIKQDRKQHYTDYYDDESIDYIADVYKIDIKTFDYKFGE